MKKQKQAKTCRLVVRVRAKSRDLLAVKVNPYALARYNPPSALKSSDATLIAVTKAKHPKPWSFVWQGLTFFDNKKRPYKGHYIIIDANGRQVFMSYPVMLRMITAINSTNY